MWYDGVCFLSAYLSPVNSVTDPVGIPPLKAWSRPGSNKLIVFQSLTNCSPVIFFCRFCFLRHLMSFSSFPSESGLSCLKGGPFSNISKLACKASRTATQKFLTSRTGSEVRLAISRVSRLRRSAVVTECFSNDERRRGYFRLGKSGRIVSRSVMEKIHKV